MAGQPAPRASTQRQIGEHPVNTSVSMTLTSPNPIIDVLPANYPDWGDGAWTIYIHNGAASEMVMVLTLRGSDLRTLMDRIQHRLDRADTAADGEGVAR